MELPSVDQLFLRRDRPVSRRCNVERLPPLEPLLAQDRQCAKCVAAVVGEGVVQNVKDAHGANHAARRTEADLPHCSTLRRKPSNIIVVQIAELQSRSEEHTSEL